MAAARASRHAPLRQVPFHCPVANVPFNGRLPFVFLRCSGHVVSERALKQTLGGKRCPITEVPCAPEDVMPLYPTEEQREQLVAQAAARKAEKKEKKKKRPKGEGAAAASGEACAAPSRCSSVTAAASPTSDATATAAAARAPPRAAAAAGKSGRAGKERAADGASKRGREWEQARRPHPPSLPRTSGCAAPLHCPSSAAHWPRRAVRR